jgi:glycosyltransferase involved in cell wall biosynthesis
MTATNPPTISIVTACYNSGRFIDRIQRSLASQSYRLFEWICVDDYSTDDTVERLLAFDPPGALGMQVYRLPQNTGGPVAWAVGFARARGEIVFWLDHDDELFSFALEEIVKTWPTARSNDQLAGMFFQAVDPGTGLAIGGTLSDRRPMTMQQFSQKYPLACDGTWAMKRSHIQEVATVEALEQVALGGLILNDLTRTKKITIADALPIRFYHRDNPDSQTRHERVSRKTVWTYARLLDQFTRSDLRRLGRWVRHTVVMNRYAFHVHGRWRAGSDLVRRPLLRLFARAMIPLSWLLDRRRPRPTIVEIPVFHPHFLASLGDLRLR